MPGSSLIFDKSSAPTTKPQSIATWLREPLLHFIVLGGVLFGVDHVLVARQDDPHRIVVGAEVDSEAVEVFEHSRGRKPNQDELRALHQVWLDNEVLYREGVAQQLDKGDDVIRERVIFKMLSTIEAGLRLPEIDDKKLREWFESKRKKYDEPARYTFEEAVLAGDNAEQSVRAFVALLNTGKSGDAQAGLRIFKDRPRDNLEQSYGADFAKELEVATAGEWRAYKTRDGWRAIKLDAWNPPQPAVFETLRGVVLQDWKDATAAEQRTAAVRTFAKKYRIEFAERPTHAE